MRFINKTIKCGTCKKEFVPKSDRNKFCCRSCFKKAFWRRQKEKNKEKKPFPTFNCPSCGQKITLTFDPIREVSKWQSYICPGCNTLMINVCEFIQTKDEQIF